LRNVIIVNDDDDDNDDDPVMTGSARQWSQHAAAEAGIGSVVPVSGTHLQGMRCAVVTRRSQLLTWRGAFFPCCLRLFCRSC